MNIGSAYTGLNLNITRMPALGEQTRERIYRYEPWGRGANTALTFSRLGADCVFCARVGADSNGRMLRRFYQKNGIDVRFVGEDKNVRTGLAVRMTDDSGGSRTILYPGANDRLSPADAEEALTCLPDALFLQLDIPDKTMLSAAQMAREKGIPRFISAVGLEPGFPLEQLGETEIFMLNEIETARYTGIELRNTNECTRACIALKSRTNAHYIVLKLGERGAFLYDGTYSKLLTPYDVDVVDTAGAGDVFSAAVTIEYLRSGDMERAVEYANIAAAIAISKSGEVASIPSEEDIRCFIYHNKISFSL